jgi:hypothetical protein
LDRDPLPGEPFQRFYPMARCKLGLHARKVTLDLDPVKFLLPLFKDGVSFSFVLFDPGDICFEPGEVYPYVFDLPGILCPIIGIGGDMIRWVAVEVWGTCTGRVLSFKVDGRVARKVVVVEIGRY